MFRRLFHIILGWYVIWFVVGLVVMAFPYESPVGHFEDFLFMALASAVIFLDATRRIGWGITGCIFIWICIIAGGIELLGSMTGFPFGHYAYTDSFGPSVAGLPWAIPLAWWVVLYPLLMFSLTLVRDGVISSKMVVLTVALLATAVDFALEPVATLVRGYWLWSSGGAYYGVPWQNFLGWFGTSVVIIAPIQYYCGPTLIKNYRAPGSMFLLLAVLGSVLTSFFVAGVVSRLWLASGWAFFLLLLITVAIIRKAWPRREIFLIEHLGRYR